MTLKIYVSPTGRLIREDLGKPAEVALADVFRHTLNTQERTDALAGVYGDAVRVRVLEIEADSPSGTVSVDAATVLSAAQTMDSTQEAAMRTALGVQPVDAASVLTASQAMDPAQEAAMRLALGISGTGGSGGSGQLTAVPMSAAVNVASANTKSTAFTIPAGSLGKYGAARIFGIIEKTGPTEAALANMRLGTVGQAFSAMAPTIGQVNNTGAAGIYTFEVLLMGNGVDTSSVIALTPSLGFPGGTVAKVSYTVDTATADFEVAIGGNPGPTTAQWKVLTAQCYIVNPEATAGAGTPVVLPWQTVTPNANGTTAVTIDATLGGNVVLNAPVNGTQVINVPTGLSDGGEMQINIVGGGGSGFWTAWSSGTPSTAGWYFPDGVAPTAPATSAEVLPIYIKRRGAKYVALIGTTEAA